jgi:glycosyltransferase involved in cell wall biosynthesis
LYRATRYLESVLLDRCDGLVVLTERLADRIPKRPGRPTVVIPCCVDTEAFGLRPTDPPSALRSLVGRPLLVYAGSVGTWYLLDEMMLFFGAVSRLLPDWHLVILSRSDHELIRKSALRMALSTDRITILAETYDRMPEYLRACSAGIAFIKPVPSKEGSSPTKIAEYLASGLPIVVNTGVGDLDRFVEQERIGIVLRSFEPPELSRGARFLTTVLHERNSLRERCAAVAARLFDVQTVGVAKYRALYRGIGASTYEGAATDDAKSA